MPSAGIVSVEAGDNDVSVLENDAVLRLRPLVPLSSLTMEQLRRGGWWGEIDRRNRATALAERQAAARAQELGPGRTGGGGRGGAMEENENRPERAQNRSSEGSIPSEGAEDSFEAEIDAAVEAIGRAVWDDAVREFDAGRARERAERAARDDVRRPDRLVCPTCKTMHLPVVGTEPIAMAARATANVPSQGGESGGAAGNNNNRANSRGLPSGSSSDDDSGTVALAAPMATQSTSRFETFTTLENEAEDLCYDGETLNLGDCDSSRDSQTTQRFPSLHHPGHRHEVEGIAYADDASSDHPSMPPLEDVFDAAPSNNGQESVTRRGRAANSTERDPVNVGEAATRRSGSNEINDSYRRLEDEREYLEVSAQNARALSRYNRRAASSYRNNDAGEMTLAAHSVRRPIHEMFTTLEDLGLGADDSDEPDAQLTRRVGGGGVAALTLEDLGLGGNDNSNGNETHPAPTNPLTHLREYGALRAYARATCPVCLEECEPTIVLPCGHCLCEEDFGRLGGYLASDKEKLRAEVEPTAAGEWRASAAAQRSQTRQQSSPRRQSENDIPSSVTVRI